MKSIALFILVPFASALWRVKPRITRPSSPRNVTVVPVSTSELGVSWIEPLYDGGSPVISYLVEWDEEKFFSSGVASPSNPYGNNAEGKHSEVVQANGTKAFVITGLDAVPYWVRVSAIANGQSPAISSEPPFQVPTSTLPGFLTDVGVSVASDSETADRLKISWSAPKFDVNGFSALPIGCGGESPHSTPASIESFRVRWSDSPSMKTAKQHDIPAIVGDGTPLLCCPSDSSVGTCTFELGAEVQTLSVTYVDSAVAVGNALFDSGAVRLMYLGPQSKSIRVKPPQDDGGTTIQIAPSTDLPGASPIAVGDMIKIADSTYVVSNVDAWPHAVEIEGGFASSSSVGSLQTSMIAYFNSPPTSCFDVGNSAENLRDYLLEDFDDSPFGESLAVSREKVTKFLSELGETRVIGYEYQVTFLGQGFSSALGGGVDEFLILSSSPGDCASPFVSNGVDVSSHVNVAFSTNVNAGSIVPGQRYYVEMAAVNAHGVGPFVPAEPGSQVALALPGLPQKCLVYATPSSSSSVTVEWRGVWPDHGAAPSLYRVEAYDAVSGSLTPVVTYNVSEIDETSQYSAKIDGLVPGGRYRLVIVPVTALGERSPSWLSGYDPSSVFNKEDFPHSLDFLERACNAVPKCSSESSGCIETDEAFVITARSVPPPPLVQGGTFPDVSGRNMFGKDSVLITFESPLLSSGLNSGSPTDKFLVEWSTLHSFLSEKDGEVTRWSSEVVASYSDDAGLNAAGELLLDSLSMGTEYFVRVSAHNTAGFGAPTQGIPVKPMTTPDPPFEPILSNLAPPLFISPSHPSYGDLTDGAIIGTSLVVSWAPPRIDTSNDRPDLVGNGGGAILNYLVEWSRIEWELYSPTIYEVTLETPQGSAGALHGSFQLKVDTTIMHETAVQGSHISAEIPVDASSETVRTIMENIPNVGGGLQVSSPAPYSWRITFASEVGDLDVTLPVSRVVDSNNLPGVVNVVKLSSGTIPAGSAYGSAVVEGADAIGDDGRINYVISQIVPGMDIFVRVSASNAVGYSPRRKTAPERGSPSLSRPDSPTSLYSHEAPPYLSIHSPNALTVHIGPPVYNGGSPVSSFLVEWDTVSSFDSSSDGSPLGEARVGSADRLCSACVGDFDLATNVFTYSGDSDNAKRLLPNRNIMVYFEDDGKAYLFTVLSATSSAIHVSSKHLRVSSLWGMWNEDGQSGCDLDVIGTTYTIDGLDSGRAYYVRVSSENSAVGTGKAISTEPAFLIPIGFPSPPSSASVTVVDRHTLNLSWSEDARTNDPSITGYFVEWWSRADSTTTSSFFGQQEVVQLSTRGLSLVGGTFRLFFGDFNSHARALGTASTSNGLSYVVTDTDMTPLLSRGEEVMIEGEIYSVHEIDSFTTARLPLSRPYNGSNSEGVNIYAKSKSIPIPYDASAADLQNALQRMPGVNSVEVRRESDADQSGVQWFVTFGGKGPQAGLSADTTNLVGINPDGFVISRDVLGEFPRDYNFAVITDPSTSTFDIGGLSPGQPTYISISSIGPSGHSQPVQAQPSAVSPGGVPGPVISQMSVKNETTLVVSFEADADENGATVEEYAIEISTDPDFATSAQTFTGKTHKIQRIKTSAHTTPWEAQATFSLSLGDFHGDFTRPVGEDLTVRINNGGNLLERSTGTGSLSLLVARGDRIMVSGVEFSVCLDVSKSVPYDSDHLSLCTKDDPTLPAYFSNNLRPADDVIDKLPIFALDTALGSVKSPAVGDTFLRTVDAADLAFDTRDRLRRGDLIRIGHPELGGTYRVSTESGRAFTDQVIPLSLEADPAVPASLSSTSLEHSSAEVQGFSIRSNSDSVMLSPGTDIASSYRVRFRTETSDCVMWDGSANSLKAELENFDGIDSVEVSREEIDAVPGGLGAGVKYEITFVGLNVRGSVPSLQVVDIGTNRCSDADSSQGGIFSQNLAPVAVEQVHASRTPIYEVQTTRDIPWDASSADVKAALESLSQTCFVDVSRRVNHRHGFSWDVTFNECPTGEEQEEYSTILPLTANGANLAANIDPGVSVVDLHEVAVPAAAGLSSFVRVAAKNKFGWGEFVSGNPRSAEASPQPPSEPKDVYAEGVSNSEVHVTWNPPINDGGRSITHYKVEYDDSPTFTGGLNGGPLGSVSVSSTSLESISDVQSVTVKIVTSPTGYLSGTFSLSFAGQTTRQLPHNATPSDVKEALEKLCNVEEVVVQRVLHCSPDDLMTGCMAPEGYTWLVTFVSTSVVGDQHIRHMSKFQTATSHKLSVNGSNLFECTDADRASCFMSPNTVATVGTAQERQMITTASSPFSVTIQGETSEVIGIGDSLASVEAKLNAFSRNGIGRVAVSCPSCAGDTVGSGQSLILDFLSYRGDMPLLSVSDPSATVTEVTKGRGQVVVGRGHYRTLISGLSSVKDYHIRVFAYNGIGEGVPENAWPFPLRLSTTTPLAPGDVSASVLGSTSVKVSWNAPPSDGGVHIYGYIVEYDSNAAFVSPEEKRRTSATREVVVERLTPGAKVFIRVAALNERGQGPFSFPGYPSAPIPVIPVGKPNAIATRSSVSQDALRIDFGPPLLSDRPLSVNGDQESKYHMDVSLDNNHLPEILSLSITGDAAVSGHLRLSVGFQGDYNKIVSSANGLPASFEIVAGSRIAGTAGENLQTILHPRELLLIRDELVVIESVSEDHVLLKEYHVKGTSGPTTAYRLDNHVGSTTLLQGQSSFVESNGLDLENVLQPGDIVQVTRDDGQPVHLTVQAISGSSVNYSPSYTGQTISATPILAKRDIVVSAKASAKTMKEMLESLPGIESVQVTREGPTESEGFTWHLTFEMNMEEPLCAAPSWCLTASTSSAQYVVVSGLGAGYDGTYVQTSFSAGRPKYELLGSGHTISFDSSEWRIRSGDGDLLSSVPSHSATMPLSGWSSGSSVVLPGGSSSPLLFGLNASANVVTLQQGTPQSFDDIVYSTVVDDVQRHEVQEVSLFSDVDDLAGSIRISFGSDAASVVVYHDDTPVDVETKLEYLPSIGKVSVSLALPPQDRFGSVWTVTFLDNRGDVPLLRHHGTSNASTGGNLSLFITEKIRGGSDQLSHLVEGLQLGNQYSARIAAENSAGIGPYSSVTSQTLATPPDKPHASLGTVTKTQANVVFTEPESNGSDISMYRLELTSGEFPVPKVVVRLSCADGSELRGWYKIVYQDEETFPIRPESSLLQLTQALNGLKRLNRVDLSFENNNTQSQVGFGISLPYDPVLSPISIYEDDLYCESELPVQSELHVLGTDPVDYEMMYLYSTGYSCGGVHLEGDSTPSKACAGGSTGTFAILATALADLGGTFDLSYGPKRLQGLPLATSAEEMKDLLDRLTGFSTSVTKYEPSVTRVVWKVVHPPRMGLPILVDDAFVTGRNAAVHAFPVLEVKSYSSKNDSRGSYIIVIDGESTAPIQHGATNAEIEAELELLEGVGKAETLECWHSQGVCYSIVIKSGRVGAQDIVNIVPESDWRGTGAVLEAGSGRAQEPMTFQLTNLDKSKTYRIRVSAMNGQGYSVPSDELELAPQSTRPGQPRLFSVDF